MEINDIISFKGKQGYLLYGRINGMTKSSITIKIFGFNGRESIRRVRKAHRLASVICPLSYEAMAAHNLNIEGITEKSKKEIHKKRAEYWRAFRASQEEPGYPTRYDVADRLARQGCNA